MPVHSRRIVPVHLRRAPTNTSYVSEKSKKMKIASVVLAALAYIQLSNALADEAAEMSFGEGSVIIRCGTPPGQDNHISNKLFEAASPIG